MIRLGDELDTPHDLALVDRDADTGDLWRAIDTPVGLHVSERPGERFSEAKSDLLPGSDGHGLVTPSVPTGQDATGEVCYRLCESGLAARVDLDRGVAPVRLSDRFDDRGGDAPWSVTLVPDEDHAEPAVVESDRPVAGLSDSIVDQAKEVVDGVFGGDDEVHGRET